METHTQRERTEWEDPSIQRRGEREYEKTYRQEQREQTNIPTEKEIHKQIESLRVGQVRENVHKQRGGKRTDGQTEVREKHIGRQIAV